MFVRAIWPLRSYRTSLALSPTEFIHNARSTEAVKQARGENIKI